MKTQCAVFIATSLDGFIARQDGQIDWLNQANLAVPSGEDCGFAKFMASIDVLVMGRNTFEQVLSFGQWPYGSTPVIVISRSLQSLPTTAPATVSLLADDPAILVERLSANGVKRIYVDGGLTIQNFLAKNLINEITVTIIPVILGTGKPLFAELKKDIHLELLESKAFSFGFVQNKYRVKGDN
jgi:dihydrofolate reductase